jgi:hypothetical protein
MNADLQAVDVQITSSQKSTQRGRERGIKNQASGFRLITIKGDGMAWSMDASNMVVCPSPNALLTTVETQGYVN